MTDIVCFDKGGRDSRRVLVAEGGAPRDFFYGTDLLQRDGFDISHINTVAHYSGPFAKLHRLRERVAGRLFGLAYRTHLLTTLDSSLATVRIALSFTDGFSLTLGNYYRRRHANCPRLIGCFHRLSDIESTVPVMMRPYVSARVAEALGRLDVLGFFGPADRDYAVQKYGIPAEKTEIIWFGVDTDFWSPGLGGREDNVFSIGQDPNRDFATLVQAATSMPIRIHTSLNVPPPSPGRNNVAISNGSYFDSTLTDVEVRDCYRNALAVVVPLKDVFQPTGCSVTLQAMACGKPVILTKTKGLWAPSLMVDGENCILVPPGDSVAISVAIERLRNDSTLRARLGRAARRTVETHFCLQVAADSTRTLIERAQAL